MVILSISVKKTYVNFCQKRPIIFTYHGEMIKLSYFTGPIRFIYLLLVFYKKKQVIQCQNPWVFSITIVLAWYSYSHNISIVKLLMYTLVYSKVLFSVHVHIHFLSPPVPMHGGLICITFCPYVTRPKVLEKITRKNSYLIRYCT